MSGVTALPIHCILRHANSFHFFKFTRVSDSGEGTFQLGRNDQGPGNRYQGIRFPTLEWSDPQTYFILHLRYIAESIFDHMLNGYICSLEAMAVKARARLSDGSNPKYYGGKIERLDEALAPVEKMREKFSKAKDQWENDDIAAADVSVHDAFALLQERYGQLDCSLREISSSYNSTKSIQRVIMPIMATWDDDQVGRGSPSAQ